MQHNTLCFEGNGPQLIGEDNPFEKLREEKTNNNARYRWYDKTPVEKDTIDQQRYVNDAIAQVSAVSKQYIKK